MASIAYVDHSFHKTTKSTGFLPEILSRHGHAVDFFWDEAWRSGAPVAWEQVRGHDVVIMFQSYCPPPGQHFRRAHPNVIYIPMLDQFGIWQGPVFNLNDFWEPFQGSKVLNFSSALHCMTTGFGIVSHFARYYQPVAQYPEPPQKGLHGFFWLRRELDLPWKVIRRLIADTKFDSFHIHMATDPGSPEAEMPIAEDLARHNITTSVWFDRKADLNSVISRANVFFAPRMEEGIGQSFLEAMARGQCVVAPNHGTMNEYILPGLNGLLYDVRCPTALDFSNVFELGRRARVSALAGRAEWQQAESTLVDFILRPSAEHYVNRYQHPALALASSESAEMFRTAAVASHEMTTVLEGAGGTFINILRRASSRYAIFRSTRFLWRPITQLASRWLRR